MKFKNLSGVRKDSFAPTKRFTFYEIEGEPWLECKPATKRNAKYFNAMLKRLGRVRRTIEKGNLTVEMLEQQERVMRTLFGEFVVEDFGSWVGEDDQEIPFTREAAKELAMALPSSQFDQLAEWAADDDNFLRDSEDDD